jgi:hypothetical protein
VWWSRRRPWSTVQEQHSDKSNYGLSVADHCAFTANLSVFLFVPLAGEKLEMLLKLCCCPSGGLQPGRKSGHVCTKDWLTTDLTPGASCQECAGILILNSVSRLASSFRWRGLSLRWGGGRGVHQDDHSLPSGVEIKKAIVNFRLSNTSSFLIVYRKRQFVYSTLIKDRDSSVGIATRYGLDGRGIESRWGRDFLHQSIPALGPIQPPIHWVPGLFPG